jgi:hypothetical protein
LCATENFAGALVTNLFSAKFAAAKKPLQNKAFWALHDFHAAARERAISTRTMPSRYVSRGQMSLSQL